MTDLATTTIELAAERTDDGRIGHVHLLPAGTFTGIDGRGPYVAGDLDRIVTASRRHAGRRQPVIDYDHASDRNTGTPATAAGWITGMQARADGIWGLVEWTARAAEHIARREYRYLSPVFLYDPKTGAIGAILRASLTNTPNLDQLTALASAQETTMNDETRTEIIALLELDAEADDATIIQAVRGRVAVHAERPDPSKFVPIGDFQRAVAEANKLRQGITLQAAQDRVGEDVRKGIILPWMKDWATALCTVNMPAYETFVQGVGPGFSHLLGKTLPAGAPGLHSEGAGSDDASRAVARNLGLTDEDLARARTRG